MTSNDSQPVEQEEAHPRGSRQRRRRLVVVFVIAAGLLTTLIATVILRPASPSSSSSQRQAPGFDLENLDTAQPRVRLAAFRGRPLVINFWASWCVPCRQEMPALEAVHQRVRDRIEFVGIDHQDTRAEALAFVQETKVSYPSAFDPRGGTANDYTLYGLPSTVFVSPDGRIVDQHLGAYSETELQAELDRLFPTP